MACRRESQKRKRVGWGGKSVEGSRFSSSAGDPRQRRPRPLAGPEVGRRQNRDAERPPPARRDDAGAMARRQ
jgi:hypothetical protein